jgi:SAM-dependent methyltransferase
MTWSAQVSELRKAGFDVREGRCIKCARRMPAGQTGRTHVPKHRTKKSAGKIEDSLAEPNSSLEFLIKYSGDALLQSQKFDLDLFKSLNADYQERPVVPAPRPHSLEYGTSIGVRRAAMLDKKIGIRGLRVLELGCGAGAMSRVLARDFGCALTGVDIGDYPEWQAPLEGDLSLQVHDVTTQDNSHLGVFDRVVSFAVFEHIVHPHAALKAIFDMLKPGGKAYIYANLYRGAKASHRYREVYFPWAHLLFESEVWRDFYSKLQGEPLEPAWVNKLTYDQYVNFAGRAGFTVLEHFPSAPFFDEAFYKRFEQRLSAYPKFDLRHDFIHLVLQKPPVNSDPASVNRETSETSDYAALLGHAPRKNETVEAYGTGFWAAVGATPSWRRFEADWYASRREGAAAIADQKPWVTFPAIEYLENRLKPGHRVFEWGSGGSTLFFANRAAKVISVEHESEWHTAVAEKLEKSAYVAKVQNILAEPDKTPSSDWRFSSGAANLGDRSFEDYVRQIERYEEGSFDLVIVDGRARMGCLAAALGKVVPGGAVMLDNANYPRYAKRLAALRANELSGWKEVRLAGPGPYSKTPCWETIVWERPQNIADGAGRQQTALEDKDIRKCTSAWSAVPTVSLADIPAIRRSLADLPCRNYDSISYIPDETTKRAVAAILAGQNYELFGMTFDPNDIGDWHKRHSERTGELFMQSWDHLEPLFALWSAHEDEALVAVLRKSLAAWAGSGAGGFGSGNAAILDSRANEDFANYDTAVANRFFRLAYFLNRTAPSIEISDADFLDLLNVMISHMNSLLDDSSIAWRHNHGLYQVLAQICGAGRFMQLDGGEGPRSLALHMRHSFRTGIDRLDLLLESQFTASGIHKEHSPFYHVAMANALSWVVREAIVDDSAIIAAHSRILKTARFMFDQAGKLANFGDSDLGLLLRGTHEVAEDAGVDSALFPDAGYWFVKGEGAGGSVYLAQSCAFHSRFHKQADSGTLIWRDRGLDVLIDSGRYGYLGRTTPGTPLFLDGFWYSDSKRVHVESTRAHNTVEIDQQNHRRYRQAPLGGTITGERFSNGVYASRCTVPNAGRVQHQRFTLLLPNHWLLIIDTCRFPDGAHDMRQWFQLHPDWAVAAGGDRLNFVNGDERLAIVPMLANMETDGIFHGEQVEPVNASDSGYRGWWSPEAMRFESCTSVSFRANSDFVNMATLISFDDVDSQSVTASVNATSRSFVLRWRSAHSQNEVKLTSGGLGREEFDIAFKSGPRKNPGSV